MPTSKRKLAEQVLYRLYGGVNTSSSPVQIEDVYEAINQKINALIKAEVFSVTLASGDTIPEGLMTATYENIPVVPYGKRSKAILPAMPVRLPRNMGVFEIWNDTISDGFDTEMPVNYLLTEDRIDITTEDGKIITT